MICIRIYLFDNGKILLISSDNMVNALADTPAFFIWFEVEVLTTQFGEFQEVFFRNLVYFIMPGLNHALKGGVSLIYP
jgi:hypothetical protein